MLGTPKIFIYGVRLLFETFPVWHTLMVNKLIAEIVKRLICIDTRKSFSTCPLLIEWAVRCGFCGFWGVVVGLKCGR